MILSHDLMFYISTRGKRFDVLSVLGLHNHLSDEQFVKKCYKAHTGDKLNLENPRSFTEKLQWLKLYNHNPEYSQLVDKYEVKKYVSSLIGEEHVFPALGIWDNFDDINFDALPDQFVLKCTHDSGSYVICRDKSKFDKEAARSKLNRRLKKSFYLRGREWPYLNVKPRILAEKYMVENSEIRGLTDYKFFCFNGEPKIMYICPDIAEHPACDFYDMEFNQLDIVSKDPSAGIERKKPIFFDQMKEFATILCRDMPHVRVDFYYLNGTVYFGEFTFFHNGGLIKLKPEEWNDRLGDWITLPDKNY